MSAAIGLVGCGAWGANVLRDLRQLDRTVRVVARSERSRERASAGGADAIVAEVDELGDVAGVVVCTPEPTHAAVLERALGLGVPVFVEKPLTIAPASARRLAEQAPDRLFVMDKWRYHPGVEMLREIADSGELGPTVGLRCQRLGWGHEHVTSDSIWHLAPHDLAIALEVMGELPRPRAAVAEVVDRRPTGLVGLLGGSSWVAIEVSAARHERRRVVELICEGGVAWLGDGYAEAVGVARAGAIGAEPEWRPIAGPMPLLLELEAFVAHLDGGPPPRSSAHDGALVVETIGALRELAGLPAAGDEDRDA